MFKAQKILLIEDEKSLINIYQVAFSSQGWQVEAIADFKKGLSTAQKIKPDLIILDLVFYNDSGELSKEPGFTTLKKLKTNPKTKKIPLIVFTNLSGDEQQRALKMGAEKFVTKANTIPKEMVSEVKSLL